ncbi:MAG: CarD family transcriptional regulator [Anaerolineae bacterium]|jgi:CarD family transcriptional regulator
MQFAVGDKVVHPHHGPGQITGIEHKEFMHGKEHYYVIDIPAQGLTLHIPKHRVGEIGVRPAMPQAQFQQVLDILRSRPDELPQDHKERQEQILEKLQTGKPSDLAEAVRDLAWYQKMSHLTKRDTDYMDRGRKLLAAEMALVADVEIADTNETIEATLNEALAAVVD